MVVKRKTPAKKSANKSKAPESLHWKEFVQHFRDSVEFDPTKAFCFIIGSGASKSAGILLGVELVERGFEQFISERCLTEMPSKSQILHRHIIDFPPSFAALYSSQAT